MKTAVESLTFTSLGGEVSILAEDPAAASALVEAERVIRDLHRRLTRFEPESELCQLNDDPRETVPASPLMLRFANLVRQAGSVSGGLVDATLLDQVERAGYVESIDPDTGPVSFNSPAPGPAAVRTGGWSDLRADHEASTVSRPPGLRLDSGGLGKGLAADLVAELLGDSETWGVVCAGDLRFGGTRGAPRRIDITSPTGSGEIIASFEAPSGAVATSGVTRRSWQTDGGRSHHLIDPRTDLPARTGLIQVTAIAPTAGEAEIRAKAALLSGPERASEWLPDGGAIVRESLELETFGPVRGEPGE